MDIEEMIIGLILGIASAAVVTLLVILLVGCIPKPQPPEYHVGSILINGVETKTNFKLGEKL